MDSAMSSAPPSYDTVVMQSNVPEKKTVEVSEPASAHRVDYDENPLVTACRNNDLDVLNTSEQLSRNIDYLFNNKEKDSKLEESVGLLHVACNENKPQVLRLLLERGANPNVKLPKSGLTPIELACADKKMDPEIVQILAGYLFPHRLDINAIHCVNSPGFPADFTLLQLACRLQNVQTIKILLNNNADPNVVAPGWSVPPLHLSCDGATVDSEAIRSLLEAKASVDTRYRGLTALHTLCRSQAFNEQALHALLAGKADVNAVTTPSRMTPLMLAIKNNTQMANLLLMDCRTDINEADYLGWQAIHYAAKAGNCEALINTLVDRGADVNAKTDKGITPLHLAMLGKKEPEIFALLERGADTSTKAPVNAFSWCQVCEVTCWTCTSASIVLACLPFFIFLSPLLCENDCQACRPSESVHERCVRRYCQAFCPERCGVTPMEMADEGLRERMVCRIITHQPEGSYSKT